jgi:hypothetical protein
MNNDLLNISLKQGKQFNVYQTKIKHHITESTFKQNKNNIIKEGFVSLEQEQIVRPSSDGYSPVLKNMQETTSSNNVSNQTDLDDLKKLQTKYNNLIQEYTDIQQKISAASLEAINRVTSNNPYLGKNLQFTDGTIVYVTNQGIAKLYTSEEIFKNTIGKNGCPKEIIKLNIPWSSEYIHGSKIPTNPSLIVGSNMIMGQSCGNEGKNVYASKLINDPTSNYIGCYNDKPPLTNVNMVPVMNSSNKNNGFVSSASSVYSKFGAWFAFDKNPNTFWHSQINSSSKYNTRTGFYEGSNGINIVNIGKVSGEFLQIFMPGVNTPQAQNVTVNQYSIEPRLDACCLTTRSPNSWYVLGYKDSQWYRVDRQQNQTFTNGTSKVYNVAYPGAYSAYILLVDRVGNNDKNSNRYCVQVAGWNLFANSDLSDNKSAMILNSDLIGYTSFDKCQEYAVDNGFNFFGLQDVQPNGNAKCLVSNDIARTKMYGDADIQSTSIPIWSSNTITNQSGSMLVSGTGQIIVFNSNGQEIFVSNPVVPECVNSGKSLINTATYGGNCKAPIGNVTDVVANKLKCNLVETCSIPISNRTFGDPTPRCRKSFDIEYKCGASKFTKNLAYAEGRTMILDCKDYMQKTCQFYVILQNDGNLCIYKGKDPSSNGGIVWSSMTSGKQKTPNNEWLASKGKFGRNYMKTSETLVSGEWIGSDDGSLKLIMQDDGNLVLYTSGSTTGCTVINNRTYGGKMINAVYELDSVGNKSTLGNIGYVDSNSILKEYPDSMVGFTNNYQIYQNTDLPGNDITTLVTSDQNGCQIACNNNTDCSAYVYQSSSQTCWLKNRSAFSNGNKQPNNNVVLGVRNPGLKGSSSCSNKISNVDTVQFDNYITGDKMTPDTRCIPPIISQEDQIRYDNVISQLIIIGNDIVAKMENLYNQDNKIFEKLNTNAEQFEKDLENYKLTNLKIKKNLNISQNLNSDNIEGMRNLTNSSNLNDLSGMLSDSDLRVLTENYSYMMWSILAVGILTITINTMKK